MRRLKMSSASPRVGIPALARYTAIGESRKEARVRTFENPILPGFYPDPSVCRVGDDFYLVTSTFAYFPGVPVFHSKDLVHWRQIGNALDRPEQLPLGGTEISRGIFAPTIRHHASVFYIITTNVSCGGNFIVSAEDPAGAWSDPRYIEGADGIDPSLFFDDDGKCYYHGAREMGKDGAFRGDNEIYAQELDVAGARLVGERRSIWRGALRGAEWTEAPHIYKIGGRYYLLTAEGGTGHEHAVSVARASSPLGPFEGCKGNPILTHRHLGRDYPIANVGHGDLVDTPSGEWWMVLLGSRPYGGRFRNMGRETFLVPVAWEDGWPVASPGAGLVRKTERAPDLIPASGDGASLLRDFRELGAIPLDMMHLRNPVSGDYILERGEGLRMRLNANALSALGSASYLCARQRHMSFKAGALMCFDPASEGEEAGLAIFQSHRYHFAFTLALKGGARILRVARCEAGETTVLAEAACAVPSGADVFLRIEADGQSLAFLHGADRESLSPAFENADARILSTDVAGGFVGTTVGMYASSNGADAGDRFALFRIFEYEGAEGAD